MLKAKCQYCHETILIDADTGNKFDEADKPHQCAIQVKVATDTIYEKGKPYNLGFSVDYREDVKAKMIVDECVKRGIDPYKVRTKRVGDYVRLIV